MDQGRIQFPRRGFPFSVESLISKPDHNGEKPPPSSPVRTTGHQSNFSVERLLDKQERNRETGKKVTELPRNKEDNAVEAQPLDGNYSWLHSTRYDPPPSKFNSDLSQLFYR